MQGRAGSQELGLRWGGANTRDEGEAGIWGIPVTQASPGFAPPCRGYAHIPPSTHMTSRPCYQGAS